MNKLFTLLLALPIFVSAQEQGDFEVSLGAGLNMSTFHGDDAGGFSTRNGAQFGVTAEYYVSDNWSFKTGFIHDSKGAEEDLNGFSREDKIDYLFVPFYANWHFGEAHNWYLNFGPYMGFRLSAEELPTRRIIEEETNQFDLGLGAGIGRKFQISDNASVFVEYQTAVGTAEVFDRQDVFNFRGALNAGVAFTL